MARLILVVAGAWIASVALLLAFAFGRARGLAPVGLAARLDIEHLWKTLRLSSAQLGLGFLSIAFAVAAGSLIASGPEGPAGVAEVVAAIGLAMGCGAAAALRRFRDIQGAGDAYPDTGDDVTEELRKLRLTSAAPFTRPRSDRSREAHRPERRPRFGRLATAMALLLAAPVAGLVLSLQGTGALPDAAGVPPPLVAAPSGAPAAQMLAVALTDGAREGSTRLQHALDSVVTNAQATDAGPHGAGEAASLPRPIDASLARRECLAQVESAHLFRGIALQAKRSSAYAVATDAHIKRMLKSHPIGPRTLQQIAQRMWEVRDAPERDPSWWSTQYARCEEARVSGAPYIVRG